MTARTDAQWKTQYRREFLRYAVSRGWDEEDAATRCGEIIGEALTHCRGKSPVDLAREDVLLFEWESLDVG